MNSDSWCSPSAVTLPLARFFKGPVDVDPCSNARSLVRAREAWRAGSLHRAWFGHALVDAVRRLRRTVYMNPPYSRLGRWVPYLVEQLELARQWKPEAVALVPVATSAGWWQAAIQADALMFVKRLTFVGDKPDPARFDAVLLYYGPRRDAFREAFRELERWYLHGEDARRFWTPGVVPVLPRDVNKKAA
jgi:hypothetical protein